MERMIDKISQQVFKNSADNQSHFVLYPGSNGDLSTLVLKTNDHNRFIVKFESVPKDNLQIEGYIEVLEEVTELLDDSKLGSSVPKIVNNFELDGDIYCIETGLSGHASSSSLKKDHISKVLEEGRKWLVSFHSETKTDSVDYHENNVLRESEFSITPESTVTGIMHGDFVMSNILLRKSGGVNVIDWEEASLEGLPVLDLLTLIMDISYQSRKDIDKRVFERVFYNVNWYSKLVFEEIKKYCSGLGIDRRQVREHIPVWISYSLEKTKMYHDIKWHDTLQQINQEYDPQKVFW